MKRGVFASTHRPRAWNLTAMADLLFQGSLFADYHQFYLMDEKTSPELPSVWTDADVARGFLSATGTVIVSTARNLFVPVRVLWHSSEPTSDFSDADRVARTRFTSSGSILIAGLMDYQPDAARCAVPAGALNVLLVFRGLNTLSDDGLEGNDSYDVHLWCALSGSQ